MNVAIPAATISRPLRTKRYGAASALFQWAWIHEPVVQVIVVAVSAMPACDSVMPRTSTRTRET